jgi:dimethylargininase
VHTSLNKPLSALLREVPSTFDRCLREGVAAIDVQRAREQHDGYATALRDAGVAVHILAADDRCPDCCFVEDTAVVLGEVALLTCPGAPSRRPEVDAVGGALRERLALRRMTGEGATLDGGDVLRAGPYVFVGLSSRTTPGGVAALESLARTQGLEVVSVPVAGGLHLKSSVTLLDPHTLLVLQGSLDCTPFETRGLRCVPVVEAAGANVLPVGEVVLVSSMAPRTADLVTAQGIEARLVDVSEFHKGDGALTCLSLRIPQPGSWCA